MDLPGISILDVFVKAKLCSSKKEAKRMINQGGLKIDGKVITSQTMRIVKIKETGEYHLVDFIGVTS